MDKYVGKRLDGRYEIQEIIGVGGMAVVYKARDNVEDRIVAIKILKDEFVSNEEFVRRFKNESRAIAVLSHPNIVKVYDVSFGDLIQYIVMEYIDGITLKELIESQGSLRWKDAVHFAIQILKGLQHAHDKGIVHRDVKPQNIMVLPDGTIKVTDFGIARFARSEQRTITDKAIGSVHYISPEQARGEKTDEKTDIYSVGVMMYEMLTGQLPFQAESAVSVAIMQLQRDPQLPTEVNGSIPVGLEQITMHAMQKISEKRYQSAAEMLCDLEEFRKDPSATFAYTYFVDDSPTKFVGNVRSATPASASMPEETEEVEETKKNNMIPILAGIAATLIISIIVLAVIFVPKLFTDTGAEIECPNFVGMTWESIKNNETYNDQFEIEVEWLPDEDAEYGYVFEQDQPAKKKLKKGAKITLTISMGQSTIKIPDVYGKTESYAVSELKSKGFDVVVTEMANDEVEAGLVIKTDPARTSVQNEGAKVTVYVSTGKATKYVNVPNLVGLSKERALADIEDAGLIAEVKEVDISAEDKYYAKGYVVSQNPDANSSSKVAEGTKVTVNISTGNYKFNVKIGLAGDCKYDSGKISLWVDGKLFAESALIKLNELAEYTFEGLVSSEKSLEATVQFTNTGESYDNFKDIEIDCTTGAVDTVYNYDDYRADDSSTSTPTTTE